MNKTCTKPTLCLTTMLVLLNAQAVVEGHTSDGIGGHSGICHFQ